MPRQVYKLEMCSPLHIGTRGIGVESTLDYIPSDTLFGALVITWIEMGEQPLVDHIKEHFPAGKSPALLLTSALPYAGDTFFLPRPNLPVLFKEGDKEFKGIQWISLALFKQLLNAPTIKTLRALWRATKDGGYQETKDPSKTPAYALMQDGAVWLTAAERTAIAASLAQANDIHLKAWARQPVPHVAVGRPDNASQLYYVGQIHFAAGCGLWVMAQSDDRVWIERTTDALTRLQDSGIGGRRFRGNGNFALRMIESTFDTELPTTNAGASDEQYQVLLSRLAPTVEQMTMLQRAHSRYDLVTIGGYSDYARKQPLVRQRVRLLKEGSVVGMGIHPLGKLVNVNPFWDEEKNDIVIPDGLATHPNLPHIPHAVHRYGYGFGVPFNMPSTVDIQAEGVL